MGFANAIRKRKAHDYWDRWTMQVKSRGGTIEQTFEEVFPQYSDIEEVVIDAETVSIMETLARKQLEELAASAQ